MTDGHATRPLYYLFSPLITFPPWLSSECLFPSRRLWRQSQMVDQISSVTIALLVLSWVVVTMRCGVRAFLVKSFGFDDWLMLVSQVSHPPPRSRQVDVPVNEKAKILYTIWGIFLLLGAQTGMGKHMATLTPDQIVLAMKVSAPAAWGVDPACR